MATTWSAKDVDDRIALNLLSKDKRAGERAAREKGKAALIALLRQKKLLPAGKSDPASVRDALLAFMASGDPDFMLINLEDMWLETRWQNVPGTMTEHPNWVHKFRKSLEEIAADPKLAKALARIDAIRKPPSAASSKPAKPKATKPSASSRPRAKREPALV
jgi:4-alpha-glucanotransferase